MNFSNSQNLRALWFGDEKSLLGHLHIPRERALDLAVVICAAPFGYENICAHRALRILADRFTAAGIAALRFDFPGTGDSDGEQTLSAWIDAVAEAVASARRETSCKQVAIVGVGLSGTIALSSIDAGLNVDKLILWGAPTTGRAWLRQQRAYQRVTGLKPNPDESPPPPTPEGIEEFSGFPMTATLAAELTALDVSKVSSNAWPSDRARPSVLVFSRTASDTTNHFAGPLGSRGIEAALECHDGFDLMFDEPHLSIAPDAIFARMRDWIAHDVGERTLHKGPMKNDDGVRTTIGKHGLVEEIARYSRGDGGLLFSIETRPAHRPPHPTWLVMLTGRAVRHIGPNRIWVRFAREMAAHGYASLRLDGRSVGDSEGEGNGLMPNEEYYQEHIYDDIEHVMQIAVDQGAKQFLMTGICSGATASYQVAWRRSDVRAIVLLNPLQLRHDPEDDERAKVQLARKWRPRKGLLLDPQTYLRAVNGELPISKVLGLVRLRMKNFLSFRGAPDENQPSYVATGFRSLSEKPVEIDIFLSGEDPVAICFLERHFGAGLIDFNREHLRVHRVANTDHTIRPLFAQERFFELLRTAIARIESN